MKIAVILNHHSGPPRVLPVIRNKLQTRIQEFGHEVILHDINPEHPATDLTKKAMDDGAVLIVAAGGDGTVNGVAQATVNTDIPIFHFPLGSGNGFARTMGIPLRLDAALELLSNPVVRKVDTGRLNGMLFLIACGFGLDALIAHDFHKMKLRGIAPYVISGLWNYSKFVPERFRMTDPDSGESWETEAMVVAATISSQYGGGAIVAPGAIPDDGWLDWIEGKKVDWSESLRVGIRLFRGTLDKEKKLSRRKVKRLQVERFSEHRELHLDGEAQFSERVNWVEIDPASLSVVVGPQYYGGW